MVSGLCNPTFALLRLAFASAPHFLLNLARPHNSPVHSSIGTPSTLLLSGLRLLVNIRFQVLFHSPPGVLFTFPSWYYALSVDICVLPWRVVPPASYGISRVPHYSGFRPWSSCFRLPGSHCLRLSFPRDLANFSSNFVGPQPRLSFLIRFRLLPRSLAATWGISFDFFSSGYLDVSVRPVPFSCSWAWMAVHHHSRIAPFGCLRVADYLHLSAAFRSLSRPSSADIAKASTVCS